MAWEKIGSCSNSVFVGLTSGWSSKELSFALLWLINGHLFISVETVENN